MIHHFLDRHGLLAQTSENFIQLPFRLNLGDLIVPQSIDNRCRPIESSRICPGFIKLHDLLYQFTTRELVAAGTDTNHDEGNGAKHANPRNVMKSPSKKN